MQGEKAFFYLNREIANRGGLRGPQRLCTGFE